MGNREDVLIDWETIKDKGFYMQKSGAGGMGKTLLLACFIEGG